MAVPDFADSPNQASIGVFSHLSLSIFHEKWDYIDLFKRLDPSIFCQNRYHLQQQIVKQRILAMNAGVNQQSLQKIGLMFVLKYSILAQENQNLEYFKLVLKQKIHESRGFLIAFKVVLIGLYVILCHGMSDIQSFWGVLQKRKNEFANPQSFFRSLCRYFEYQKCHKILIMKALSNFLQLLPLVFGQKFRFQFFRYFFIYTAYEFVNSQVVNILLVNYAEHQSSQHYVFQEHVKTHRGFHKKGYPELLKASHDSVIFQQLCHKLLVFFEELVYFRGFLGQGYQYLVEIAKQAFLQFRICSKIFEQPVQMRII